MAILSVTPLAAGNALRVLLRPVSGAEYWRVLRKDADTISGAADAGAVIVHEGRDNPITDFSGLLDGAPVYYRAFYWLGDAWVGSASVAGTPAAGFQDLSADPQSFVRERLELGLMGLVQSGGLAHENGFIPVLLAPPLIEGTAFPVVTVQLVSSSFDVRGVGEGYMPPGKDGGLWHVPESGLSRVSLDVYGWCLSADGRRDLRNALRSVILANLEVFDAAGMAEIELSFSDLEDFEQYDVPLFMVRCSLSCIAPTVVDATYPLIREVSHTIVGA